MRILALDLGPARRGGQRQTHLVTRALAARGHEVAVAVRAGCPLLADLRADGLETFPLRPGSEVSPSILLGLARAGRRFRPDVIWASEARGHGAAVWSRLPRLAPLVVHRRVTFPPRTHGLSRLKYRAAVRYLAVSGAVADVLVAAGIPRERIAVVPDGLPPEAYLDVPAPAAPPYRLVHIGAFDGQKGQEVVVRVIARLRDAGRLATALFLGDGPTRAEIERLAAGAGVADRCTFAGSVVDVPARLAASHLLLLPSASEGAPLALVEAMAAGCPAVSHDVGGARELTDGGTAGLLLPDLEPARWEAAVASLLDAGDERARLVAAGRRFASTRTVDRAATRLEAELASVA